MLVQMRARLYPHDMLDDIYYAKVVRRSTRRRAPTRRC